MLFTFIATVPSPAGAASSAEINSIFDFLIKGGPVMIPIGVCSLIALAVIFERLLTLRRRKVIPPEFLPRLQEILNANLLDGRADEALDYCRSQKSAIAGVFAVAMKRRGESEELLEKHIQEAGEREAMKLRKNMRVLAVIGSVAPLLGLLGTITGMITAFQTVAASGEALGRTELLAEGIYEAMITTAAGLIVAIPVVVVYHWLSARVDGLVAQIDHVTMEFMEENGPSESPMHVTSGNGRAPGEVRLAPRPARETVAAS